MALNFLLPAFGLGCAPLGGDGGVFGMESEAASDLLVQHSLAQGVTLFDTAGLYGAGLSERRLGHALAGVPRQRFQIATKIGVLINPDGSSERSYRRDAVKRSIADSLQRLQLDFIEIAHIHDADSDENFRTALDEAYPVLADLKAQGVIRAIGAGMNQWQREADFARNADFDCFLLAGRYTLLDQEPIHEYLPLCFSEVSLIPVSSPPAAFPAPGINTVRPRRKFWRRPGALKPFAHVTASRSRRRPCNFPWRTQQSAVSWWG